ncbi:MAG: hypothetical protein JST26_15885 [Bacteroidetes bacterium]|nr:hypothetical protein [Bacteroidota bacterium]
MTSRLFQYFITLILGLSFCRAQTGNITYFDEKGHLPVKTDTFYYRVNSDTAGYYRSYYYKTNKAYFTGGILSAKPDEDVLNKYTGVCTWYYADGLPKKQIQYDETGLPDGIAVEYSKNGRIAKKTVFVHGKIQNKHYEEYTETGDTVEVWEDDFLYDDGQWAIAKKDSVNAGIRAGGMQIINRSARTYQIFCKVPIDSGTYSIETNINLEYVQNNQKEGILFNYQDSLNYCSFMISRTRFYTSVVTNGHAEFGANGIKTAALKYAGWNNMKILVQDSICLFYINRELLQIIRIPKMNKHSIGLHVDGRNMAMFENVAVKQYSPNKLQETIRMAYLHSHLYMSTLYGLRAQQNGIMISKDGYIFTYLEALKNNFKIIVHASINDSIHSFFADLVGKDILHNIALLKISNANGYTFAAPAFSYLKADKLALESPLTIYQMEKDEHTNRYFYDTIGGILKSPACFENFKTTFDIAAPPKKAAVGAPVFTNDGELIGILDEDAGATSGMKIRFFKELLLKESLKIDIPREQKNPEEFRKLIKSNIVLIQVI